MYAHEDLLVEEGDLTTGDVESLLLCLCEEGTLVLGKFGIVNKGISSVVVF